MRSMKMTETSLHTDSINSLKELYDRDVFRPFGVDAPQATRFDDLHDLSLYAAEHTPRVMRRYTAVVTFCAVLSPTPFRDLACSSELMRSLHLRSAAIAAQKARY